VVVERAQGQFPVDAHDGAPRLSLSSDVGALVEPSAESIGRVAQHPGAASPRLAREVLVNRPVEDAVREIARTWARVHAS
jgi:hypothetical protein